MTPISVAAGFAVGLLGLIVVFFLVVIYNDVVALERRIDKAWANIEVVLQQRHDQLPALVDAVRGLMAFERDVLTAVTRARAAWSPEAPIPAQAATAAATTRAVRSLFATVERYPEIRSAANVMALQEEIERLEGMLADRRELYNDQVYRLNARIAQVPAVLLARLFGWEPRSFFDADPDAATPPPSLADAIGGPPAS
jgi:LemA protein